MSFSMKVIDTETIKQEMLKFWKRPATIPTQSTCHARIRLNKNGTKEVVIEKPSQALALNISVRNFLLAYDFPQHAFGKDIVIIF